MRYSNASELLLALGEKGFEIKAPINVDEIAKLLEIEVFDAPDLEAEGATGCIFFDEDKKAIILINPFDNTYEPRRRFTLAHELGHYCLHLNDEKDQFVDNRKTMSRSASYWDPYEAQANNFAAQLLMPKNLIVSEGIILTQEYEKLGKDLESTDFIRDLANRFNVSIPAMEYRLSALGIIGHRK